jgi:preprotein translocase subunit Sec61beta
MSDNRINLPSGSGGLVRYNEEYESKLDLRPAHVVIFILFIIAFRIILPFVFK